MKSRNHLGIELTRLNTLNARIPDEKELENNHIQGKIIELTQSLFERSSSRKVFIKFLFSENSRLMGNREIAIALAAVRMVRQVVSGKHPDSFFSESIASNLLPDGLENLLILCHPQLEVSFWERANHLGISENVVGDVREVIRKKDEKLRLYQKQRLNYYWLLITTDRLLEVKSFRLHDKMMNHSFLSRFQHVFLFDLIQSNVIQLV